MASQLPNWLHRLWCKAFAFRGANAVLTVPTGDVMLVGHCHGCGWTRVVASHPDSAYRPGYLFWPTDR